MQKCLFKSKGTIIRQLMPLLREYQIDKLTKRCEKYLMEKENPSVENLLLADQFDLTNLYRFNRSHVVEKISTET